MLRAAQAALTQALSRPAVTPDLISARTARIHQRMLSVSPRLRRANFDRIGPEDLELMFRAYDQIFFEGFLEQSLNGAPLRFHLSTRMMKTGGMTKRYKLPSGEVYFEILGRVQSPV